MGDLDRSQHSSSGAEDSGGGGGTVAHAGTHDDFIQRLANLHSRLSASSQTVSVCPNPHTGLVLACQKWEALGVVSLLSGCSLLTVLYCLSLPLCFLVAMLPVQIVHTQL